MPSAFCSPLHSACLCIAPLPALRCLSRWLPADTNSSLRVSVTGRHLRQLADSTCARAPPGKKGAAAGSGEAGGRHRGGRGDAGGPHRGGGGARPPGAHAPGAQRPRRRWRAPAAQGIGTESWDCFALEAGGSRHSSRRACQSAAERRTTNTSHITCTAQLRFQASESPCGHSAG